jgi:RHS repeat-associated protein
LWKAGISGSQKTIHYYHADNLGTSQRLTDKEGEQVWTMRSEAFGETTIPATVTTENNLRFPGQYYDSETGRHYNWNRDYDPTIGKYIQSDPIGLEGGINIYGYAASNPVIFIDPEGKLWFPIAVGAICGGISGYQGGGGWGGAAAGAIGGAIGGLPIPGAGAIGGAVGGAMKGFDPCKPISSTAGGAAEGAVGGAVGGAAASAAGNAFGHEFGFNTAMTGVRRGVPSQQAIATGRAVGRAVGGYASVAFGCVAALAGL